MINIYFLFSHLPIVDIQGSASHGPTGIKSERFYHPLAASSGTYNLSGHYSREEDRLDTPTQASRCLSLEGMYVSVTFILLAGKSHTLLCNCRKTGKCENNWWAFLVSSCNTLCFRRVPMY